MGTIIGNYLRITVEVGKKEHLEDGASRFIAQFKKLVEADPGVSEGKDSLSPLRSEAAVESTQRALDEIGLDMARHLEFGVDSIHVEGKAE